MKQEGDYNIESRLHQKNLEFMGETATTLAGAGGIRLTAGLFSNSKLSAQMLEQARRLSYWEDVAKPGQLSNKTARAWYLSKEQLIDDIIDASAPLQTQAEQAFGFRNLIRDRARSLMADRKTADYLRSIEKPFTWDGIIKKYQGQGFEGDDLWLKIIEKSKESRVSVNEQFRFLN
jgi:hypothetical protein